MLVPKAKTETAPPWAKSATTAARAGMFGVDRLAFSAPVPRRAGVLTPADHAATLGETPYLVRIHNFPTFYFDRFASIACQLPI